jgi:hypothetical protein
MKKIIRLTEGDLVRMVKRIVNESRTIDGRQAKSEHKYITTLISYLDESGVLGNIDYTNRFAIPLDDTRNGRLPFQEMANKISEKINKPFNDVIEGLKQVGNIRKKDAQLSSSPLVYRGNSGLENLYEILSNLLFQVLNINVDNEDNNSVDNEVTNYWGRGTGPSYEEVERKKREDRKFQETKKNIEDALNNFSLEHSIKLLGGEDRLDSYLKEYKPLGLLSFDDLVEYKGGYEEDDEY